MARGGSDDFIVLQGGGKDGWAYTRENIENMVRSGELSGNSFPFVTTGQRETFSYSPKNKGPIPYEAEVWAYDASKDVKFNG